MNLDIDNLISFFQQNSKSTKNEMGEQDSAGGGTPSGGSGKAMPKWADIVGGPARGKSNRLGLKGEKWETGAKRGVSNTLW
jgi:hypothetical protein